MVVIALATIAQAFAIKPPREQAPTFHAKSMDGEKFSNASLKGKVVLLQFWATWCKYCRADQKEVDDITREFADRGLVVAPRQVVDVAAHRAGVLLQEMLVRSSTVLVPLVPSIIDLHATGNFLRELTAMGPVKYGHVRMAVIANKVRRSMPAYAPLQSVLDSLGLKLLTRLIDSDVFLKAAESGTGIFELNPGLVAAERKQFMPIVEWVTGLPGLAEAAQEAARVCDLARTRAA